LCLIQLAKLTDLISSKLIYGFKITVFQVFRKESIDDLYQMRNVFQRKKDRMMALWEKMSPCAIHYELKTLVYQYFLFSWWP
jgi:hypothetical protein